MLGRLLYVLYIVICGTILSPSCTVRCPGVTESLVLLSVYIYIYTHTYPHNLTSQEWSTGVYENACLNRKS